MKSKVTIKDIAYLSGVSISTVSRVVSGKNNVNESTRKKVEEVIQQTGYEPNYTARALATKNTNSIAVIIDRSPTQSFGNSFIIDALDSIATTLSKHNKDMILVFASDNKFDGDSKIKQLIQSNKIDGVIKLSVQRDDFTLQYLIDSATPTVVIGRPDQDVLNVNNDNVHAMRQGVDYLISQGHNKIAFVGGDPDLIVTMDRLEGYKQALTKAGMQFRRDHVYYTNFDIEDAYILADKLVSKEYDAVATTDDLIAFGIARRLKSSTSVKDILTFNKTLLTTLTTFPLTIIDINVKEIGKRAVELLLNPESKEKSVIVNTKLNIRS